MSNSAFRISSKGQITIPFKVRQRLGVKPGDKVEFVIEEGKTVLKPAHSGENPFNKWIGAFPMPEGETHDEWFRAIRYGDEPYE